MSRSDGGHDERTRGLFDVDERLAELSAKGDDLERLNALDDFELFRPALEASVPRASLGGLLPLVDCQNAAHARPALPLLTAKWAKGSINRFLDEHNGEGKPFTWTADPDKIIAAVKRGHQALDSIH